MTSRRLFIGLGSADCPKVNTDFEITVARDDKVSGSANNRTITRSSLAE